MIGMGVLLEALDHPNVNEILVVGRKSCGLEHEKIKELIHTDFMDYSTVKSQFKDYDACFFCLG